VTTPVEPRHLCLLGGGGFLGSHLVRALIERTPHRLVVVDTSFTKLEPLPIALGDRLRLRRADVRTPGVLEMAVAESDLLLSLTALCTPALYTTRPREVIEANFSDLVPLVSLCTTHRRWLVHFSTCEVYGKTVPSSGDLHEESPLRLGPLHRERWTYACAKQLLERLIWAQGTHDGLPFTIIRPFNVIGPLMDYIPGVDGEGTPRVLACFMRALLAGEPLRLVDGGQHRRSFCAIDDFVEAILRVLERPAACQGEVLNVGNPRNDISIAELAARLAELFVQRRAGERPRLEPIAAEELYGPGYDDVEQRVPDIGKARRLLDWEPRRGLDELLPTILDDYLARYGDLRPGDARRA
jgi:UDP-apiose/xylose synthase